MKKYLRHKIANLVVVDEICTLEYRNYNGKYSHETEQHNFWEICYVEKGTLDCVINEKPVVLRENEIFFIPPNISHNYDQNENTKVLCIGFGCLSPYLKPLGMQKLNTDEEQRGTIAKLVCESAKSFTNNKDEQLVRLPQQELGCMQMLIILLEYLILLSLRQLVDAQNSPLIVLEGNNFYDFLIDQIKRYCQENVKKKITLNSVCQNIGYSKSFTCKVFKDVTGESIFSYFNGIKIEEAKKLLLNTNYSAMQISDMLDYSDGKYFNTAFKKVVGVSPVQYRKQQKTLPPPPLGLFTE